MCVCVCVCVIMPWFLYSFIHLWTLGLFSCLAYCKQCCNEHSRAVFSCSLAKYLEVKLLDHQFSSVQSLSHVRLFATPWIAVPQASLSITNSWSSLNLTSIESVMPSSHLILYHPLLLPPIPPSIRVFSNESTLCMR